jgi:hypothetical protein
MVAFVKRMETLAIAHCPGYKRDDQYLVIADFNGITLRVGARENILAVVLAYRKAIDDRNKKWQRSPKGRRAAHKAEEFNKQAAAARAEGIKSFALKDPNGWKLMLEKNQSEYGSCVMRYAARWANLMEQELAKGAELKAIAKATSCAADTEGITGFMYGCAVSILAHAWENGEELRQWHNLSTQLGNEGEKANESGGVLNPALLSIQQM